MILSADWSISRLLSWTCSSLPTIAEFVKLTQSIVIEIQRQSADLYKTQLCNRQFFVVSTAIYVVKVYECHPLGCSSIEFGGTRNYKKMFCCEISSNRTKQTPMTNDSQLYVIALGLTSKMHSSLWNWLRPTGRISWFKCHNLSIQEFVYVVYTYIYIYSFFWIFCSSA